MKTEPLKIFDIMLDNVSGNDTIRHQYDQLAIIQLCLMKTEPLQFFNVM